MKKLMLALALVSASLLGDVAFAAQAQSENKDPLWKRVLFCRSRCCGTQSAQGAQSVAAAKDTRTLMQRAQERGAACLKSAEALRAGCAKRLPAWCTVKTKNGKLLMVSTSVLVGLIAIVLGTEMGMAAAMYILAKGTGLLCFFYDFLPCAVTDFLCETCCVSAETLAANAAGTAAAATGVGVGVVGAGVVAGNMADQDAAIGGAADQVAP